MSFLEKTVKQGEELRNCGCECSAVEGLAHVTKHNHCCSKTITLYEAQLAGISSHSETSQL